MATVAPQLVLRPYQLRCKKLAHDAIRAGFNRVLVVAPTGAGKRYQIVDWGQAAADRKKEVLIATDRRLLVEKLGEEFARFDIPFSIIMDGYEECRVPHIQVATIQSLESRYLKRDPSLLPRADLILIDEAHKAIEQYKALLALYPDAKVLLLTATPVGPGGKTLIQDGYADCLTEGVKNSELIRDGYLLRTRIIAPSEPNIEGVKIRNKEEFPEGPLSKAVAEVTCFADVFNEWAPFADRKTIIFAPGIAYCNGLMGGPGLPGDSFYGRGIRAAVLTSKLKPSEKQQVLDDFIHGDLKVLISVDILKEGVDIPEASCAIDLQPNAQFRGYWQKVGRIKRPFGNQKSAVYIDMAGNYWRFPHPDTDPDWEQVTGEVTTQDVIQKDRDKGQTRNIRCPKCAAVRQGGRKCPECGHEAEERDVVRSIRMGNGKLKEIPATEKKRVEKSDTERRIAKWKSSLFIGLKTGKTLKQVGWIHKQRHGEWPQRDWPCVPSSNSATWNMRVGQAYDAREIMRAFSRADKPKDERPF